MTEITKAEKTLIEAHENLARMEALGHDTTRQARIVAALESKLAK